MCVCEIPPVSCTYTAHTQFLGMHVVLRIRALPRVYMYMCPSALPGTNAKSITLRSAASLCHVPSFRVNHLATNAPSFSVSLSLSISRRLASFKFPASYTATPTVRSYTHTLYTVCTYVCTYVMCCVVQTFRYQKRCLISLIELTSLAEPGLTIAAHFNRKCTCTRALQEKRDFSLTPLVNLHISFCR